LHLQQLAQMVGAALCSQLPSAVPRRSTSPKYINGSTNNKSTLPSTLVLEQEKCPLNTECGEYNKSSQYRTRYPMPDTLIIIDVSKASLGGLAMAKNVSKEQGGRISRWHHAGFCGLLVGPVTRGRLLARSVAGQKCSSAACRFPVQIVAPQRLNRISGSWGRLTVWTSLNSVMHVHSTHTSAGIMTSLGPSQSSSSTAFQELRV
jgi:hypothetical protein